MKLTLTNKALLTLGSLGVAATIAGAGTWATFTDTESEEQSVAAGTVILGSEAPSFSTAITDLAPGDTVIRPFQLNNDGSLDFQKVDLDSVTSSATGANTDLFEDATNPLQMMIERCSVPWTDTAADADTLADDCTGTKTTVLVDGKATKTESRALTLAVADLEENDDNHLLATFRLPVGAGNDLQGDAGTLTFSFTATQRNATDS